MSLSRTYPMPRRVALSVGMALIRWARSTARASAPAPAVSPTTEDAQSSPMSTDAAPSPSIVAAGPTPDTSLHAGDRVKAIRQHRVDRQVERERDQAMRRYLTLPRQL